MSTATEGNQQVTRVVRKIKCAAMVNSLAKSWQGWASDHTSKQDTIPAGWMPDSIIEDVENKEQAMSEVKQLVNTRVVTVDASEDLGEGIIRAAMLTKSVAQPRPSECGSDWVSTMKEKINTNQMAPSTDVKNFLGNESPTRRRYCGFKAATTKTPSGQAGRGERKLSSRSSSLETEDSGLGEDTALSDHSDQNEAEQKKPVARPKIKVTTMSDIKNRWQKWSQSHVENQKLNPFSEEFDYEHAMSTRLQKGDAGYGRPKEGSKTAERGDRAHKHIHKEMDEMCFIIRDLGMTDKNGRTYVTFGRLFDRYVKISDKVVGILLRCRKHNMLDFEGEMLWKGQDDHVIITLRD
ncbi:actin-binding Rho-activating protein [Alosa sapidissima]|uniref:actin-binding Rho-activating protein n=1 Tax=Alosa sapidissima TaxID=34773 RepID=UPI001C08E99F|nr:actin-binding Rho-activating protein [Alosa sapidissima]